MTDTATPEAPKLKKTPSVPCGFCISGHHPKCINTMRNGDGSLIRCRCCGATSQPRCVDCNRRGEDVDPAKSVCVDRDDCAAYREVRRERGPIAKFLREYYAGATASARVEPSFKLTGTDTTPTREQAEAWSEGVFDSLPPEVQAKVVRHRDRPRKAACRCCGEPTKGGTFLPGHDARYISSLARDVELGCLDKEAALSAVNDKPALMAKLERKLSK